MNSHLIAGVVYILGAVALGATPLDDKIKTFEAAVKVSPRVSSNLSYGHITILGRDMTIEDLDLAVQHGGNTETIEGIVTRLMATHSSDKVQQTGDDLVQELEAQRKTQADAFEAKADAVLAKVQDALTQAKKTTDLDQALKDLQTLQPTPGAPGYEASPALAGKINATFQFVTQWQDYLSAMSSGNMQQAQNNLRMILENRQIDAPIFFPRSEILARLVEASGGNPNPPNVASSPTATVTDPDIILAKIKQPDDFQKMLPELARVPGPNPQTPWDWSWLASMDKTRLDAVAGLPVSLNFQSYLNGPYWGDNISRIVAMELLASLPYYFGTDVSDPPKPNETVSDYLERLSGDAETAGNLALLQRVIAVKVALVNPGRNVMSGGTPQFLAGLSQEAAGQFAPAVVSYENALKNVENSLPVHIVGERLAAIQKEHPDEFEKGMASFTAPPPPINLWPGYGIPPWNRPGIPGMPGYQGPNPVTVLPIPMAISIPARATASPDSKTDANPVNPSPQPVPK